MNTTLRKTVKIRFVMESPAVIAFQRHECVHSGRARFFNGFRRFARKPREGTLTFAGRRHITADRHNEERRQKYNGDCPNNRFFTERSHIGIIGKIAQSVENNIESPFPCPEQISDGVRKIPKTEKQNSSTPQRFFRLPVLVFVSFFCYTLN